MRVTRHRRTESLQAVAMAPGESMPNLHEIPWSSLTSAALGMVQPNRCTVATNAVVGPATADHQEPLHLVSLRLASWKARASCWGENQQHQWARAQQRRGAAWASKAGRPRGAIQSVQGQLRILAPRLGGRGGGSAGSHEVEAGV